MSVESGAPSVRLTLDDQSSRTMRVSSRTLAGKVLRVSPPLVMPLDEAKEYFDVMHNIFAATAQRLSG